MPARFQSEYSKHYQPLGAKRPNTLKARDYRDIGSLSPPGSSRPAGLMSSQSTLAQEPPLQRKKIVPYVHNHNIFQTCTVKELTDREWLQEDGSSVSSMEVTKPTKTKKKTVYEKEFGWKAPETASPIINAEQRLASSGPQPSYPYVRDGISRKTEYVTNYKTRAQPARGAGTPARRKHTRSVSPEKLPPAGVPTYLSTREDKRLLKPSDDGVYTKFKYGDPRRTVPTEYQSNFKQDGQKPARRNSWHGEEVDIFKEVLDRRNQAYFLATRNRGTHFSKENLDKMYRENAKRETKTTASNTKEAKRKQRTKNSDSQVKQGLSHSVEKEYSPDKYSETASTYSEYLLADDYVGRSPTPDLIEQGQSRRHHYDLTTPAVGGAVLTTPYVQTKSKTVPLQDKMKRDQKLHTNNRQTSPRRSNAHSTSTRSLYNESLYSENEYNGNRGIAEKPLRRSVGTLTRDDDVMSVASMSSRASVASDTLERAKNRRDVWSKPNKTG